MSCQRLSQPTISHELGTSKGVVKARTCVCVCVCVCVCTYRDIYGESNIQIKPFKGRPCMPLWERVICLHKYTVCVYIYTYIHTYDQLGLLGLFTYVLTYIHAYREIYEFINTHTHTYTHTHTSTHTHAHTHTHTHALTHTISAGGTLDTLPAQGQSRQATLARCRPFRPKVCECGKTVDNPSLMLRSHKGQPDKCPFVLPRVGMLKHRIYSQHVVLMVMLLPRPTVTTRVRMTLRRRLCTQSLPALPPRTTSTFPSRKTVGIASHLPSTTKPSRATTRPLTG